MTINLGLCPEIQLNKYILKRFLGRGFFSEVWVAQDVFVDREIAVKVQVLSKDEAKREEELERILFEAQIGVHLTHDHLMKVLSVDATLYNEYQLLLIAMEYYQNGSVVERTNSRGFIPISDGMRVLVHVLKGLEHLHENRVFHGDIKPRNIIIGNKGEGIISDYGISRYAPDLIPVQPSDVYRLHVAPETIHNDQISVQTDIYQTGITAFRLLNGDKILNAIYSEIGWQEYQNRVVQGKILQPQYYLPFIPDKLKRIIEKSTHVNPEKRFKTALEMRRALEKLSFQGYWTCDFEGKCIGIAGPYEYSYNTEKRGDGFYNLIAVKKNRKNNRETRIKKYSCYKKSPKYIDSLIRKYYQFVVTGN